MNGEAARTRGRTRELDVVRHFRSLGYVAYRLNRGSADVIALKREQTPLLIQVKSTARPFERFGPDDRVALVSDALDAGARPLLAWWPKNGTLRLLGVSDWPVTAATL